MHPPHMTNALIRRGVDPGILAAQNPLATQQSPGSPIYNAQTAPMAQPSTPMPDKSPDSMIHPGDMSQPGGQPPMPNQAQGMPAPQPNAAGDPQQTEAEVIISALTQRLEHHSKQAEKFLKSIIDASKPPDQAQGGDANSPQASFMSTLQ